jgi:hypothetical protein
LIIFVAAVYVQCNRPVSHPAAEAGESKKSGPHISATCDQAEELASN